MWTLCGTESLRTAFAFQDARLDKRVSTLDCPSRLAVRKVKPVFTASALRPLECSALRVRGLPKCRRVGQMVAAVSSAQLKPEEQNAKPWKKYRPDV